MLDLNDPNSSLYRAKSSSDIVSARPVSEGYLSGRDGRLLPESGLGGSSGRSAGAGIGGTGKSSNSKRSFMVLPFWVGVVVILCGLFCSVILFQFCQEIEIEKVSIPKS